MNCITSAYDKIIYVNWVLCVVHTAILISNNCDDPNKQCMCIVDEYVILEYAVLVLAVLTSLLWVIYSLILLPVAVC